MEGMVKFNVDGSSLGKPGPTDIRGILRDHLGNEFIRFSKRLGLLIPMKQNCLLLKRHLFCSCLQDGFNLFFSGGKRFKKRGFMG
ncbi:hypothetical protein PTKIN_Ptkin11bG0105400 [Pterospermum kingtungense]